ncbi:TBC1 domain family member 10A [Merluccius polli]|uniref:TBC1 domain family member 10A n=1 Tax=Merluccius polli TaxID=89951 RepID=A0AA47N003_MERPO|nr:TBC1 domain family member 10A [Merluccius polli]
MVVSPSCPRKMSGPSSPDHTGVGRGGCCASDPVPEAAAETDRFGFLLANGSTAGRVLIVILCYHVSWSCVRSVGPAPEQVRQREAKWISIISKWDHVLQKKNSKVKEQCQKGIPASLRAKCWPLLCGATDRMKGNKDLYSSLDSLPALQSWVDVIERDLDRQFPFHEMFVTKDGHGQRGLFRVLKAYTQYQPDEGYCQAQGPVAAVLLMNMPAEPYCGVAELLVSYLTSCDLRIQEAFWCLVQISEQYLPGYYSQLLEGVLFDAALLSWVLKRTCLPAHKHLQRYGVEPLMFATDWLMCLFTRHLPFNTLLRVWDLFFCYGVRVLFQVAVVLVRRVLGRAEQRQECSGQMETLERLRGIRESLGQEDDASFMAEVSSVSLSRSDLKKYTEKELEKWRKDRPSSTFDPRGRCHGHWALREALREERDRKGSLKDNLSISLIRSSSVLSLSPSLLHKRRGKQNDAPKVQRHHSMGVQGVGRESWMEARALGVSRVEEEEHTTPDKLQSCVDTELTQPTGVKRLLKIAREPQENPIPPRNALKVRGELKEQERIGQLEHTTMVDQAEQRRTEDSQGGDSVVVIQEVLQHHSDIKEGAVGVVVTQSSTVIQPLQPRKQEQELKDNNLSQIPEEQELKDNHLSQIPEEQELKDNNLSQIPEEQELKDNNQSQVSQEQEIKDNNQSQVPQEQELKDNNLSQIPEEQELKDNNQSQIPEEQELKDNHLSQIPEEQELKDNNQSQIPEEQELKDNKQSQVPQEQELKDNQSQVPQEQELKDNNLSQITEEQELKDNNQSQVLEEQEMKDNTQSQVLEEQELKDNTQSQILKEQELEDNTQSQVLEEQELEDNNQSQVLEEQELEDNTQSQVLEEQELEDNNQSQVLEEQELKDNTQSQVLEEQELEDNTQSQVLEEQELEDNTQSQVLEEQELKDNTQSQVLEEQELEDNTQSQVLEEQELEDNNQSQVLEEQELKDNTQSQVLEEQELKDNTQSKVLEEQELKDNTQSQVLEEQELKDNIQSQITEEETCDTKQNQKEEVAEKHRVKTLYEITKQAAECQNLVASQINMSETTTDTNTDTETQAVVATTEAQSDATPEQETMTENGEPIVTHADTGNTSEYRLVVPKSTKESTEDAEEGQTETEAWTTDMNCMQEQTDMGREVDFLMQKAVEQSEELREECDSAVSTITAILAETTVVTEADTSDAAEALITENACAEKEAICSGHAQPEEETVLDTNAEEAEEDNDTRTCNQTAIIEDKEFDPRAVTDEKISYSLTGDAEHLTTLEPAVQVYVRKSAKIIENDKETVDSAEVIFTPNSSNQHHTGDSQDDATVPQVQDAPLPTEVGPAGVPCDAESTNTMGHQSSAFSGDFRVCKSSNSHSSRLARRLSEDIFTPPQASQVVSDLNPGQAELTTVPGQTGLDATLARALSDQPPSQGPPGPTEITGGTGGEACEGGSTTPEQRLPEPPKRPGFFSRLRGGHPKHGKDRQAKTATTTTPQNIQVPKIFIQDFSDGVGEERPLEEVEQQQQQQQEQQQGQQGQQLSSKDRRRKRREQEREEKVRKRMEKELKKEGRKKGRKGLQWGKDECHGGEPSSCTVSETQARYATPHTDSYF